MQLLRGDCRVMLGELDRASIDAVVTDPPYELGFMGKKWDCTGVAFQPETWRCVFDVLKPGAHLVAFGGTRTFHRMACAIEDVGFELRDTLMWMYGTGFPKSHDVSKGISNQRNGFDDAFGGNASGAMSADITAPATPEAARWQGWGTALKPAWEPIILARKPVVGTVAANVLAHGTGALNIDGCRIPGTFESGWSKSGSKASENVAMSGPNYEREPKPDNPAGRWPANVVHDGSEEVEAAFAAFGERPGAVSNGRKCERAGTGYGMGKTEQRPGRCDFGSASRFFYSAKASAADRAGSKHPTVKPLALMRWLCRMVTPPGGRVLDPFAGSGTTLQAAVECGLQALGIEMDETYQKDIIRRMHCMQPALV